jgi:branched-chain amino acid transport system ATP-binding protein
LSSPPPLLEVRDVVKHFGGVAAVDGASLEVASGSVTALIGPNGAGKTSLFNAITGFQRAERGTIRFDGTPIQNAAPHRIARRGLVRTFQTARVFPRMSVLENAMLAIPEQPGERLWRRFATPRLVRRRDHEAHDRAREQLALVRLDELRDEYAGTLSGGQRKLLELARALLSRPTMVLLDEPMAGVNPTVSRQLVEHVRALNAERGLTFLLIEHDLELVMELSDRVIVMNAGAVIAAGTPGEVRSDPRVVDAYLGTAA